MRILHVFKTYDRVGGMEKYLKEVVSFFREKGHKVDVLAVNTGPRLKMTESAHGKTIELPRLFEYASAVISLQFPRAFRKMAHDYDIIHFHYPNPIGEISYLLSSPKEISARTVATFHNDVSKEKPFSASYNRWFARKFLEKMDRIIVTSPNFVQTSPVLAGLEKKTSVVPLGIDLGLYAETMENMTKESAGQSNADFPLILFVGRLARVKGIEYLIKAMAGAPGILLVAGAGPLRDRLEKLRDSLGLEHKIRFLGYVSDDDLRKLYRRADIFVLPSVYRGEGFGYVLLEAMIHRTAIISTELGTGSSYANIHGETGYVVAPKDPEAIRDAILKMSADPERFARFRENAFNRVRSTFGLDKMLAAIESIYAEKI